MTISNPRWLIDGLPVTSFVFGRTAEMVVDVSDFVGGEIVFKLLTPALAPPLLPPVAVAIGPVGAIPRAVTCQVSLNHQWKVLERVPGTYSLYKASCDAGRTLPYPTNESYLADPITDDLLFPPLFFTASAAAHPTVTSGVIHREMPAFVPGNLVELLVDGDKIQASLLTALAAAQHHVHLDWFFFDTKSKIAAALIACRARGVEVRLLFDQPATAMPEPYGQGIKPGAFLEGMRQLETAGVKVGTSSLAVPPLDNLVTVTDPEYRDRLALQKAYAGRIALLYGLLAGNTVLRVLTEAQVLGAGHGVLEGVTSARELASAGVGTPVLLWGCRDHTKLIIVDGTIAFTGGANGQRYYLYDNPIDPARDAIEERDDPANTEKWTKWHDAFVRVEGPAVLDAQRFFVERWAVCTGEYLSRTSLEYFPAPQSLGPAAVKVIANIPGLERDIAAEYVRMFRNSAAQIRVENPYITDDFLANFMAHAAQIRQVPVEVIVPDKHLDVVILRDLMKARWDSLRGANVAVYAYNTHMLHVKVATADGLTSIVSSYNLSKSSADQLFEFGVVIENAAFAAAVEQKLFDVDRPIALRVTTSTAPDWTQVRTTAMPSLDRLI